MKKVKKVSVVQDSENVVETNVLATAIVEISAAVKRLEKSGLTLDAVVVLTQDNCRGVGSHPPRKPTKNEIREVLRSIGELTDRYCR